MSHVQIPNVPSPSPLCVGGPDTEHHGFKEPMKWMRESKKVTMEECDAPKRYKATAPLPDYLTDLIYQFRSFAPTGLSIEAGELLRKLQSFARLAQNHNCAKPK